MLTIGLIGCGIWGRAILRDLLSLGVSVKVFDSGQWAVNSHHSPLTNHQSPITQIATHLADLADLADTDGLIVATPSSTHRAVLEKVLPWQLPTFVEKPLTTSLEDARYLASLPHSTYIYMMHVWRYHGGIQLLGELARNGRLGNITALRSIRSNWTSPRTDTDSVWNLAPHDLTIALEILGYLPPPKAAAIEWHQGVARGMTALLGDSPFVQIEVSNRSPDKRREVRLFGTEGMAVLADEKTDYLDVYYGDDRSYPAPVRHEKMYFDATPPLRRELAAFIGFLQGGPAPISNFQEGLLTIEVLAQLEKLAISPQSMVDSQQ
jgi:predicted dehydrogenase